MLWLKGWSIIAFMQQKNIYSERSIMKAFLDSKHGILHVSRDFTLLRSRYQFDAVVPSETVFYSLIHRCFRTLLSLLRDLFDFFRKRFQ